MQLPDEGTYSATELNWIDSEPSGLFPSDQTSIWGQARKVFADYMQLNLFDKIAQFYANLDPATCNADDIANWEQMLGIPPNDAKTLESRIAFVQSRRQRGPFTRTRRRLIVEAFILATQGVVPSFGLGGLVFDDDGIPFFAGDFDVSAAYRIVEDIPAFEYSVAILSTVDVDIAGLTRELDRITPAPITFDVELVDNFGEYGSGYYGMGGYGG